jgi:hypothetical protein
MTLPPPIRILAFLALSSACDPGVTGPRRGPPPGLAQLNDDACTVVLQCRELAEACGGDQTCIDALDAVVEEPSGEASTIPGRIIEIYAPRSP